MSFTMGMAGLVSDALNREEFERNEFKWKPKFGLLARNGDKLEKIREDDTTIDWW